MHRILRKNSGGINCPFPPVNVVQIWIQDRTHTCSHLQFSHAEWLSGTSWMSNSIIPNVITLYFTGWEDIPRARLPTQPLPLRLKHFLLTHWQECFSTTSISLPLCYCTSLRSLPSYIHKYTQLKCPVVMCLFIFPFCYIYDLFIKLVKLVKKLIKLKLNSYNGLEEKPNSK